ncbi:MAG: transcription termination factor NusA [Proteobacteria bacterium]|nr:transcription termination factor NusA [Pseudomonadota bacterium]
MSLNAFGNKELLQIVDSVARNKSIQKENIFLVLEDALKAAAKQKYGSDQELDVKIDRNTGEIRFYKINLVVENEEQILQLKDEGKSAILIEYAKLKKADVAIGDILYELLPPLDMERVASQYAKQVIVSQIKKIERDREYEDFKDRVGQILSGVIDKIEYGNIILKIGSAEAIIYKNHLLQSDIYKQGSRIKALFLEINRENNGPQIILSRTDNNFLKALCVQEIPEIADGMIEIKGVVRDPGLRAKIAVYCPDKSLSIIGACVGIKGNRIKSITNELHGEKIDIVEWSADIGQFTANAFSSIAISKVIVNSAKNTVEVVVQAEQQSIAIGRRGQNVRLISDLIGYDVELMTEEVELERRSSEFKEITELFMRALDVEEILAQLLASEGFRSARDLANSSTEKLLEIDALDEYTANELISRAKEFIELQDNEEKLKSLDQEALKLDSMTTEIAISLNDSNIKSISDIADLSRDEMSAILEKKELIVDIETIDKIIMSARKLIYNF